MISSTATINSGCSRLHCSKLSKSLGASEHDLLYYCVNLATIFINVISKHLPHGDHAAFSSYPFSNFSEDIIKSSWTGSSSDIFVICAWNPHALLLLLSSVFPLDFRRSPRRSAAELLRSGVQIHRSTFSYYR